MKNRGRLFVITGPSGVGKDTILRNILIKRRDIYLSVSATTRMPRNGEINGTHYLFLNREEFESGINDGDFLEYALYAGNYYGTLKKQVEDKLDSGIDVIVEIEVQGAAKVFEKCPDAIMIFIVPPSFEELERRLSGRATEDPDAVRMRLEIARNEVKAKERFHHIIVNDNLKNAVRKILNIIKKEN